MPPVGKPLFLTPEELARALRVDPETVRRWLREGQVRGQKAGRLWRVPWEEGVRLLVVSRVMCKSLCTGGIPLLKHLLQHLLHLREPL
ncbi:helix-turn-helix domain-containing protein [Thermus thermophilus]|uniref:helix-turn-helix domain-containing protein n=1 Tax=Thermus thermophilus TaxID=274 RepID=UPI00334150B3